VTENMGTELNPDLVINIDGTDRLSSCKSFTIKNAGILKIPTAEIALSNKNGYYTTGTHEIKLYDTVYIDADVRGVTDRIFYGRVYTPSGELARAGSEMLSDLLIECKAEFGQKMIRERITRKYADEGWLCKEAIEDFLANPDSGSNTGITLETDSGLITTTPFPRNLDGDTLLSAIRAVAEKINYSGYWKGTTWNTLFFKAVGTEACSPAISLSHPFMPIKPKSSIEEIKNYIMVKGSTDQGFPVIDDWCEQGITKYPTAWVGETGVTVSDVTTDAQESTSAILAYFIKIKNISGVQQVCGAWFDIVASGYKRPQGTPNYVDCVTNSETETGGRFTNLHIWISAQFRQPPASYIDVLLQDINNDKIKFTNINALAGGSRYLGTKSQYWVGWAPWIGDDTSIFSADTNGQWGWFGGSSSFNWKIKRVGIQTSLNNNDAFFTDGIAFRARAPDDGGMKDNRIDPLINPIHCPPIIDSASITSYGRTVYPYPDESIKCFEHVRTIGERFLSIHKNPFKQIVARKGAKTWAKPSQHLSLTLSQYGISSEDWRAIEIMLNWTTKTKLLRSTLTLVPKLYSLPTSTARMESRGGLLAELIS